MIRYKKLNPGTSLPACGRNRANKTYPSSTMRPITIVKPFLKGETPSVPLPPDIDDDATSHPSTGSWLLVSHSGTQANHAKNTKEVECQTTPLGPPLHHRPRFCAKRFFDLSKDDPTSVPSFSTRSKLPKLHYGGLQASQLDCFGTSSGSDPCLRAPQPVPYLKPAPKSLPSRASFRKAIATLQSTTEKHASEAERARSQLRVIQTFLWNSQFWVLDQRFDRVADSLGTGGFLAYIQLWNHWACWCQCHMQVPAEAPLSLLLDYLHASGHLKRRKDSKPFRTRMMTHIKALRWMALKLDLPIGTALQSQTVSDCLKSQTRIPFERWEASPIPLAVLAAWEFRILSQDSSLLEVITLGCFLIASMASLRFRDLLRTKPESLTIQGHILRGISWRTKTSVSGQPCWLGFTTRPSTGHWYFASLKPCSWALTKAVKTWVPIGPHIFYYHFGQTPPHFQLHALTTMLLLLYVSTANAVGFPLPSHQSRQQIYPLTAWSLPYLLLRDNSIWTWRTVPNRGTTRSQFNSTPEMMFGQAFSSRGTS